MRVKRPVLTDFAFQPQLFTIGREQQLNGGGVKADPVVERLHLMFRVDAFNRHHRHQNMFLFNQARVAGKERFNKERLIGHHHVVYPRAGDIDARKIALVVDQFVHLGDNDPVVEGGGFDQRRGIFGAGSGVKVAFAVGFIPGD